MYNEKIKKKYIELQENNPKEIITLFNQVESIEESENTDLYNLPLDVVIKNILQQGKITSIQTARKKIALIKKYKNWAIVNNYVGEDAKYIDPEFNIQKIYIEHNKSVLFKTPKDLKDITSLYLYRRSSEGVTSDEIITAFLMLLYQGFTKEETLNLTLNDITLVNNNMAIKNNRTIITAYPEFTDIFFKIYNNRVFSKISKADSNTVIMDDYFLSMGNISREVLCDKICRLISKRLYPNAKFKLEDLYIMGQVYKAKARKLTYEEFFSQLEEELDHKIYFKEKLRLMYKHW